jgi:hypothetical protein
MPAPLRSWICGALGLFLGFLGLYALTSAGRIDFIDGQYRYEVARNWLDLGAPILVDPPLFFSNPSRHPRTGDAYALYNAGPSVTPMPLMLLSRALPGHTLERDRFAFSMAGPIFGALSIAAVFAGQARLGVPLPAAAAAAGILGLATQWWPASVTTFDQNQHALLLLGAVLMGWEAGQRGSATLAGAAGLAAGLLLTFQESYLLLLPPVAWLALADPPSPPGISAPHRLPRAGADRVTRGVSFLLAASVGLLLFLGYNYWRFETLLQERRYDLPWPRDLVAGILSLLVSPGKGVFLFSPPLLLAVAGIPGLWRRARALAVAILAISFIHVTFAASLPFFGGEWSWGPRYLAR